jgi:polyketide synthase PksN
LATDDEMREAVDKWIQRGKYEKLLDLWVKGLDFDWTKLHGAVRPRRISLPAYPFAKESYWFQESHRVSRMENRNRHVSMGTVGGFIHPLLHQNTSDLSEQRFSSIFTGQEFFLADHVVKSQRVFPGVAYLEMARAAVETATKAFKEGQTKIVLQNIVWARPMVVGEQPVQVHIGLFPENNGEIAYEIYTEPDEAHTAEVITHSQGSAILALIDKVPTVDLTIWQSRCTRNKLSSHEVYATFRSLGFDYGAGHQGIETLYVGNGRVLAKLSLPSSVLGSHNQFVLHPSIMDAALQATIGLMGDLSDPAGSGGGVSVKPLLPFALDQLKVYGHCASTMWALIQTSEAAHEPTHQAGNKSLSPHLQKLDIDLCDETGTVLIQMKGFTARTVEGEVGTVAPLGVLMLKPVWNESDNPGTPVPDKIDTRHLVILYDMADVSPQKVETLVNAVAPVCRCLALQPGLKGIDERFKAFAVQVFEEIKNFLSDKSNGPVLLQIIAKHDEQQFSGGLSGLLKTAQLENPRFTGQLIEVEPGEDTEGIVAKLNENSHFPADQWIRYQNGRRMIAGWSEIETTAPAAVHLPWNDRGVYLITGGAGGLGLILAGEITHQVEGTTLILTGRSSAEAVQSSPHAARLQELMDTSALTHTRIIYRQADLTKKEEADRLIQSIREEFGTLHGIIHGAGIIRDNYIIKKSKSEFLEVLDPKVTGLVNLDQASQDLPLDFLIIFSSGAGAMGNPGQSDYATANAFMDAYAKYRNRLAGLNQRHGRTLAIDWPLWKEGGMRVSEVTGEIMRQTTGMIPLETRDGIRALYQSFISGQDQVMVMAGDMRQLKRYAGTDAARPGSSAHSVPNDAIKPFHAELGHGTVPVKQASPSPPTASPDILQERANGYFTNLLSLVTKLPAHRIEADAPFEKYGMDSIMAMELTDQLEKTFGSLSKTLFFEYQDIQSLTGYFLESYPDRLADTLGFAREAAAAQNPIDSVTVPEYREPIGKNTNTRHPRFTSHLPISGGDIESQPAKTTGVNEIAIIGVTGRYPGAENMQEFWNNLRDGRDCITEIPKERWDHSQYFDEDQSKPGKTYCKWGGFLEGVDQFDPLFFNISPREAELTDPQERLFLETVWNLLESAGLTREKLQHQYQGKVGVYVGAMYQQYHLLNSDITKESATAVHSYSSIANRVSYFFNFQGPSIVVDTACSSSAIAVHMACESLIKGDCRLAIAGGVNLTIHPKKYLGLSLARIIGSRADSRSFGDGDGYLPGEGVGAVLLKPLALAIRDRDSVLAVIKATATNHGGHSNGFTVPNLTAQAQLFEDNFRKSGIDPRTISYVEAAANGSALGDPIELNALTKAFRKFTSDQQFCAIGSVKSNIGHAEAASGISQLTKVILQLQHQQLVPSIKADPLNPNLSFNDTPFYLQREPRQWCRPEIIMDGVTREYPRRATVSSFGAGGSNAHLIIEEYIPAHDTGPAIISNHSSISPQIIVLSARSRERLIPHVKQMLEFIEFQEELDITDLAYTLQNGREAMEFRLAMVVSTRQELVQGLKNYLKNSRGTWGQSTSIPVFYGDLEEEHPEIRSLLSGKAGETLVQAFLEEKNYPKIAMYWAQGGKIPWESLHEGEAVRIISLPTYAFEKKRYWIESQPKPEIYGEQDKPFTGPDSFAQPQPAQNGQIVDIICDQLGISRTELNLNKPLYQYGFDSILLMSLFQRFQSQFDPSITLDVLREARTAQDIINVLLFHMKGQPLTQPNNIPVMDNQESFLEAKASVPKDSKAHHARNNFPELIHLNRISQGRPVFWFHAAIGGVEAYQGIAQKSGRPFYGIQARGWMNPSDPIHGIPEMAAYYTEIIRSVQAEGPYDLGGYSLGGVIAYEVARQLQEMGQTVDTIVMLDSIYLKRTGVETENEDISWKNIVFNTINMMLLSLSQNQQTPDSSLGLIHRDELDIYCDKDGFLTQIVNLAKERGLKKTQAQLRNLIQRNTKVLTSYAINDYNVLPLPRPDQIRCYYFRNQSRAFYGGLEPYFAITPYDGSTDQQKYWQEWQNQIRDFQITDLDSSSHIMMLNEPKAADAMYSFCEKLYHGGAERKEETDTATQAITTLNRKTGRIQKITILAFGSRGDVQPFVALGKGLKKAGYAVTIAAINEYKEIIANNGLYFAPLHLNSDELKVTLQDRYRRENKAATALSQVAKGNLAHNIASWLDNSYQASFGCDILLYTGLAYHFGIHLAEKLKVPSIPVYLQPITENSTVASFLMPQLKIGAKYNHISYRMAEMLLWRSMGGTINHWRRNNGLKPLSEKENFAMKHRSSSPVMYGFSFQIFPRPAEWGDNISLPGYFFLEKYDDWQPAPKLARFLEAGPPPVYVGFGSMNDYLSQPAVNVILEALKQTGERIILAMGWENVKTGELGENIFVTGYTPHHWLFPKMKAIIHQGGAGTTAATLQAGVPSIVIPFMLDQPFWGERAYQLGVCPKPVSYRELSVPRLMKALEMVLNEPRFKEKAAEIGKMMNNEDGVTNAVARINQWIAGWET